MPFALAVIVAGLLVGLAFYAFAKEPGPSAAEAAMSYREAMLRADHVALFELASKELRGGMNRVAYVRAATARGVPASSIPANELVVVTTVGEEVHGDTAVVRVRSDSDPPDVDEVELHLERRAGRWVVVGPVPDVPPDAD